MSYQVLARKWRPRKFSELVGQEHVVRALVNGLDNDRLHHAFLFTGTRGVGKTTIARIFAKALNCKQGVSSDPCGECEVCRDVDEGRFVDLIEVDAASETKVDDTRELLENVQYAPTRGRYKVYLVDEVHMLSTHSFNALLKTLEEPPPHVKFLLATTDPQKLPVTVLSRCLQFNLKRLPSHDIAAYLEQVVKAEDVEAESAALEALALAADGSMRDALSLLDQAIAHGGGKLEVEQVRDMLGTLEQKHIHKLLESLAEGDGPRLWQSIQDLSEFGPDFAAVLRDLAAALHRICVLQMAPDAPPAEGLDGQWLQRMAEAMSPEDVQLAYEIAVQGRSGLDLAPDPRSGFEMALLRMLAFRPRGSATGSETESGSQQPAERSRAGETSDSPPRSRRSSARARSAQQHARASEEPQRPPDNGTASDTDDWEALIGRLGLRGPAAVLASNSVLETDGQGLFKLKVPREQSHLRTPGSEEKIREAMARLFGADAKIVFVESDKVADSPAARQDRESAERQQRAQSAIDEDPVVQQLKSGFDATVISDSVKPLNGG